jgi:hypothetical protein
MNAFQMVGWIGKNSERSEPVAAQNRLEFASDPGRKLAEPVHSPATVFGGRPVST